MQFFPEGQNSQKGAYSYSDLECARRTGVILESCAVAFDAQKQLIFDLGCCRGIMPYEECALGIKEGLVRDIAILTRVGRPCCFTVVQLPAHSGEPCILSRRTAQLACQKEYLDTLIPGDIFSCLVTSLEPFGAFCDVGCGISALLPIDCMSVSRIASPANRLALGQSLHCVLRQRDTQNRLVLSLKELLGSWEENAAAYHAGETVLGIVRSIESYGVFVELRPNLTGLAEPTGGIHPGQIVSVYIKSILPEKMKVKLVVLNALGDANTPSTLSYTRTKGHLSRWDYSPAGASKQIFTVF